MERVNFENLRIYQLAEELSDAVWETVVQWDSFARDTVGKQFVRSADSIGANISEGSGQHSKKEKRRFTVYARGSLYETLHWLRRAFRRKLLNQEQVKQFKGIVEALLPQLSAYIRTLKADD